MEGITTEQALEVLQKAKAERYKKAEADLIETIKAYEERNNGKLGIVIGESIVGGALQGGFKIILND